MKDTVLREGDKGPGPGKEGKAKQRQSKVKKRKEKEKVKGDHNDESKINKIRPKGGLNKRENRDVVCVSVK